MASFWPKNYVIVTFFPQNGIPMTIWPGPIWRQKDVTLVTNRNTLPLFMVHLQKRIWTFRKYVFLTSYWSKLYVILMFFAQKCRPIWQHTSNRHIFFMFKFVFKMNHIKLGVFPFITIGITRFWWGQFDINMPFWTKTWRWRILWTNMTPYVRKTYFFNRQIYFCKCTI